MSVICQTAPESQWCDNGKGDRCSSTLKTNAFRFLYNVLNDKRRWQNVRRLVHGTRNSAVRTYDNWIYPVIVDCRRGGTGTKDAETSSVHFHVMTLVLKVTRGRPENEWRLCWLGTASVVAIGVGYEGLSLPKMSLSSPLWNILVKHQEANFPKFSNFDRFCTQNL